MVSFMYILNTIGSFNDEISVPQVMSIVLWKLPAKKQQENRLFD
jgi:hypothetical protein